MNDLQSQQSEGFARAVADLIGIEYKAWFERLDATNDPIETRLREQTDRVLWDLARRLADAAHNWTGITPQEFLDRSYYQPAGYQRISTERPQRWN